MNESEKLEELKDAIIGIDQRLQELSTSNSVYTTAINNLDSYVTVNTIEKSFPNNVTLDLDDIKNLIIIYKGREYLVDAETFISLLFNYEEIIREIIREELNL